MTTATVEACAEALLTEDETAKLLGITKTALRHHAVDRRGPRPLRVGREIVYLPSEVQVWVKRPKLAEGPIECAPWCQYNNGHPTQFADDQQCFSDLPRTDLSLHKPPYDEFPEDGDYVEVFLSRKSTGPVVVEMMLHDEQCLRMTLDEAHQVLEHLQTAVNLAEAAR
jgi:predicted DNA-binding transcriptional regulator AlpA